MSPADAGAAALFLGLWAQVWALQVLKDARYGLPPRACAAALSVAVVASAAAAFAQKRRRAARAALALAGLWHLAARGSSSNHVALQAAVALAVVETHNGDAAELRQAARQVLAALYFLTFFAKLNNGFVSPHSCAAQYAVAGAAELGITVPERLLPVLPWLAIGGEMAMALCFGLRAAGRLDSWLWALGLALCGFLFHVGLATPRPPLSVYPFSALMAPLFALGLGRRNDRGAGGAWALGAAVAAALAAGRSQAARVEYPPYCSWDAGLLWCAGAFGLVVARACTAPGPWPRSRPRGAPAAMALLLALGTLPYLGVRTHPAFVMFSNLRVEGGASNHWVMTPRVLAALDLGCGAAADVVTVMRVAAGGAVRHAEVDLGAWLAAATGEALDAANVSRRFLISPPQGAWPPPAFPVINRPFRPFGLPFAELRRRVAAEIAADTSVVLDFAYERRGVDFVFRRRADGSLTPGSDPALLRPPGFWLKFRAVDTGAAPCRH